MRVVAGVDSSTQSCTVALHDVDSGELLGVGWAAHAPTFPPISEQDPEMWWQALAEAFAGARAAAGVSPADILGISVAAQCHGLVALNDHGQIIRPAKLWNDTTSAGQTTRLVAALGPAAWADRVGSVPVPAFTITKLAWLSENEPEHFGQLAHILLPHDWLTYRLTGRYVTDRSEASGTGYYSAPRDSYDEELLRMIDPDRDWAAMVPAVHQPSEPAGQIMPDAAAFIGASPEAIVGCGSGDQHASAVGLGIVAGDIVFVFGTSGVVYGLSDVEVPDASGAVTSVAGAAGGFQPLVCTLNAAKVTDTVAALLGVNHDGLSELAIAAPRSADRLVFAAFLDGERTPDRPGARGTLAGISTSTTRESVALAAIEGVVFGLESGRRTLASLGVPMDGRVIATGGGAASAGYLRVLADTLGRDVSTIETPQPVARGAAIQAAALLREQAVTAVRDAWAPPSRVVATPLTPVQPEVFKRYATLARWEGLDS
jgi:xylulokinase